MTADRPDRSTALLNPREVLGSLFAEAVAAVRGDVLLQRYSQRLGNRWIYRGPKQTIEWQLPDNARIIVVGAGKAAAAVAVGLEAQFGDRIDDGCIIVKYGHSESLRRIRQIEAGHPVPDANGLEGTRAILRTLEGLGPDDRVFVIITGGASALMTAPADGISLADKACVTSMLLHTQASIEEINIVREALSAVKGGRLLDHIAPARSMTLLISDIPSGDLSRIGSGPTARRDGSDADPLAILSGHGLLDRLPRSVIRHLSKPAVARPDDRLLGLADTILLADSAALVDAVESAAAAREITVQRVDVAMQGSTHDAAHHFTSAMKAYAAAKLPRPCLFVSAGETTLEVRGSGLGGRNQEFALTAALDIAGMDGCAVLAAGTDGTDGPTPAAGGFADGTSRHRAAQSGRTIEAALADNDSYHLLASIGDLHLTGPTGTNVMDLVLGLLF